MPHVKVDGKLSEGGYIDVLGVSFLILLAGFVKLISSRDSSPAGTTPQDQSHLFCASRKQVFYRLIKY